MPPKATKKSKAKPCPAPPNPKKRRHPVPTLANVSDGAPSLPAVDLPAPPEVPVAPVTVPSPLETKEAGESGEAGEGEGAKPQLPRRIQSKTPAQLYRSAEERRQRYNRKYINHCKKYGIPYPHVSVREAAHLNECHQCQQTWPLFLYEQHYVYKHPMEDVSRAWCDMPELERTRLHSIMARRDRAWLKSMIKTRTINAFQIYVRDIIHERPELRAIKPFKVRTNTLAKMWAEAPAEVRKAYEERASHAKIDRLNTLSNMPEFKKKQVILARKEYRRSLRATHPPKPPNAFLLFLRESWGAEKKKPSHMKYFDFQRQQGDTWKVMSEAQRKPYMERAAVQREAFLVRREEAQKRVKALKDQERAAKAAQNAQKKAGLELPAKEPQHTDDEGDNPPPQKKPKPDLDPKSPAVPDVPSSSDEEEDEEDEDIDDDDEDEEDEDEDDDEDEI